MNSRFRRNSLLANTTLILLRNIWGIFVRSSPRCKLYGVQTHHHTLPELRISLTLTLPKSHRRITTKKQLDKVERNIKVMG